MTGEKPEKGCVFCNAQKAAADESLIVHEGRETERVVDVAGARVDLGGS